MTSRIYMDNSDMDNFHPYPTTMSEIQEPNINDIEIVENFEFTLGETRVVLKNATKDLIQTVTQLMLKERNAEEKPTEYGEDD